MWPEINWYWAARHYGEESDLMEFVDHIVYYATLIGLCLKCEPLLEYRERERVNKVC